MPSVLSRVHAVGSVDDTRCYADRRVLPKPLSLHDVRDVEASIAQELQESFGVRDYGSQDYIELMEYLIDVVCRESIRYDPSFGLKFRTVLNWRVKQRTVDWLRSNKHDERSASPRPEVVHLSDLDEDSRASGFEDHVMSELAVQCL